MKLSEAIRLGAMLRPQGRGAFFIIARSNDGESSSCALGAAFEAKLGLDTAMETVELWEAYSRISPKDFFKIFPIMEESVAHPVHKDSTAQTVFTTVVSLNDCWGWTREQIADWVESVEKEHEQNQPVEVEQAEMVSA